MVVRAIASSTSTTPRRHAFLAAVADLSCSGKCCWSAATMSVVELASAGNITSASMPYLVYLLASRERTFAGIGPWGYSTLRGLSSASGCVSCEPAHELLQVPMYVA